MSDLSSVSAAAFLVADPTRAAMLMVLLDGRALPAGELARAAGVTAQTASSHLSRLLEGGLVEVEAEGRHRYYRLAGSHVAQALEQLAAIRPAKPASAARPKALSPEQRQLRWCRSCYDHLAGQVGVAVTRALRERDYLRAAADKRFAVTAAGVEWFGRIGVDIASIEPTPRGLARPCLDWTERFHHLGGPLGVRLLETLCAHGWLRRSRTPRVLTVTPKGWAEFGRTLGLTEESVRQSQG
ncbi:winged helix-turn-helix domain-containing protein [Achromobacter sp. Marseille-Q4962]|uniref:ArsR/SmtB family transcription factor n=1 Tax=Achromobacter sp. Marseille-Q4962 TaxID=2942202 RepID=UPI0020740896|nr:winged helix-turn-helix domain-containing protein [Achromobacter sp. Marseille-Q4962]